MSDALGWYHVPLAAPVSGTFELDAVADSGNATHAFIVAPANVVPGSSLAMDLVSGLWRGGEDCDDLAPIPARSTVDYASQIQPLWNAACTGCHVASATNSFGLDLTASVGASALIDELSHGAPGVSLVARGEPLRSFLMEKIGCASPQSGVRMRPATPMPLADQALVRDWIALLGTGGDLVFRDGFE
jgi:hypothetical protein